MGKIIRRAGSIDRSMGQDWPLEWIRSPRKVPHIAAPWVAIASATRSRVNQTAPRYSIRQLAEHIDTPVRTLRRWIHTGAIRPTDFRGPATSYGARHLDEARAVKRLLAENLTLVAIRAQLLRMTDEELARFVAPEPVVAPVEAAASAISPLTAIGPLGSTSADPGPASAAERWEHLTLLPGLQLLVRCDSGALVRRIAEEIQERYAVAKS